MFMPRRQEMLRGIREGRMRRGLKCQRQADIHIAVLPQHP